MHKKRKEGEGGGQRGTEGDRGKGSGREGRGYYEIKRAKMVCCALAGSSAPFFPQNRNYCTWRDAVSPDIQHTADIAYTYDTTYAHDTYM